MPLSRNPGILNSWNPLGHTRPVTGLLYLFMSYRTPLSVHTSTILTGIFLVSYLHCFHSHGGTADQLWSRPRALLHPCLFPIHKPSYQWTLHHVSKEGIVKQRINDSSITIKQQTHVLCIYTDYITLKR